MPKNVPAELEDKFKSCVEQVMADGQDEAAAHAICYTSIVEGKSLAEGYTLAGLKMGARNSRPDTDRLRKIRALLDELDPDWDKPEDEGEEYPPVKSAASTPLVTAYGGEIKSVTDAEDGVKVSGYLVRFDSPDITPLRDVFTADTRYGFTGRKSVPVFFHHGQPLPVKSGKPIIVRDEIGTAEIWKDDTGVLIDAIIYNREAYQQAIGGQVKSLGWSSGALAHLVDRVPLDDGSHFVKRWIIGEASLTPTPAEPQNDAAYKSGNTPLEGVSLAPADKNFAQPKTVEGAFPMSDEQTPKVDALEAKMNAMSDQLAQVLKFMQDAPATKNAGYYSHDGGKADTNVKSFGDWLIAVQRGDEARLRSVYGSTKALNESNGSAGGFMVPEEFNANLFTVAYQASPLLNLVTRVPVGTKSGTYPALDVTVTPTAGSGQTALAAGVKGVRRAEAGAYSETEPGFYEIKWDVNDFASGYTQTSKELKMDSPIAIETLLTSLFGIAVASKLEYGILRGTGIGEPLGILNANAKIGITPDTNSVFAYTDAAEMMSRAKIFNPGRTRWVYHPSIITDFSSSSWTQGNNIINIGDLGYGNGVTSEHLPQADNSGCVVLADFSAYLLFLRGTLEVSYSEHYGFINGKDTWRFSQRADGHPWLKAPITLADPQGSFTQSPFVYFND